MRAVTDAMVAAYVPLVERLARQLDGQGGAEYDDLKQEGFLAVHLTLRRGLLPSREFVRYRMRNWVRTCRRRGFTGYATTADPFA